MRTTASTQQRLQRAITAPPPLRCQPEFGGCSHEPFFLRQDAWTSTRGRHHRRKLGYCCSVKVLVYALLVNSNILTVNYGVKQSQFTKSTSEPRASDSEESNEAFDHAIRGWLL